MGIPWKSRSSIILRVLVCQILGFGPLGSKNSLFMTMSVFRHLPFPSLPKVESSGDRDHHSLCTDSYEVSFTTWPHPDEAAETPGLLCWGLWPAQWWLCQGDAPVKSFALSASKHTLCLPSYKWRNWSKEVLVIHLGYTIPSAEHGLSQQLAMPLALQ